MLMNMSCYTVKATLWMSPKLLTSWLYARELTLDSLEWFFITSWAPKSRKGRQNWNQRNSKHEESQCAIAGFEDGGGPGPGNMSKSWEQPLADSQQENLGDLSPTTLWKWIFFFLVLLRNNWNTSLYKLKACSMIVWFTYIMKWLS